MSRKEFMEQLERLLGDIPEEERMEALAYYNGYFEDAGVENEADIIRELESPEKVAGIIKADIGMEEAASYTDATAGAEMTSYTGMAAGAGTAADAGTATAVSVKKEPQKRSGTEIVLLVLLAVFTSPIWLGLLGGLFGLLVGVLVTILAVFVTIACVVFVFYVLGIVFVCVGISMFAVGAFAAGVGLLGAGCIVLALAVLGTVGCVWLFGKCIPWLIRGTVHLCSRPFQRKERVA